MQNQALFITLVVFLGINRSFGYVIRRKLQDSAEETMIWEGGARRVEEQQGRVDNPLPYTTDIPHPKTQISAERNTDKNVDDPKKEESEPKKKHDEQPKHEEQSNHEKRGHEKRGHEKPGHEKPGHEKPGHEKPGHEKPGHEKPGHEKPGHEKPGHEKPGHEKPGHEKPGHKKPGHEKPGHKKPGHEKPGHKKESHACKNYVNMKYANDAGIKIYLIDRGFMKNSQGGEKQYIDALRRFARFRGLRVNSRMCEMIGKVVGHIETILKNKTKERRCGDPDIEEGKFSEENIKGTFHKRYMMETQWARNSLTYKITSFANNLNEEDQTKAFEKAFQMWTDYAPALKIDQIPINEKADITISFESRAHGDAAAFDGPGLVFAHSYYPEDGRIHFDKDEAFTTTGEKDKLNLLSTAAHEIGHALGLGHSSDPKSIMYPEYEAYNGNTTLSEDDAQGIKNLYSSAASGTCTDQFWCEDINAGSPECKYLGEYCQVSCNRCQIQNTVK